MRNKKALVIVLILAPLVIYAVYDNFKFFKQLEQSAFVFSYTHEDVGVLKDLFPDSIIENIDFSLATSNNMAYKGVYSYNNDYRLIIYKLKDFRRVLVENIHLKKKHQRCSDQFDKLVFGKSITYNGPEVTMYSRYSQSIDSAFNISYKVQTDTPLIKSDNFKLLIQGKIDDIDLSNSKRETQINISYNDSVQTAFIYSEGDKCGYIIIINRKKGEGHEIAVSEEIFNSILSPKGM